MGPDVTTLGEFRNELIERTLDSLALDLLRERDQPGTKIDGILRNALESIFEQAYLAGEIIARRDLQPIIEAIQAVERRFREQLGEECGGHGSAVERAG